MQNAYKMPTRMGYAKKGCWKNVRNPLFLLACPEGFEPPTVGLEAIMLWPLFPYAARVCGTLNESEHTLSTLRL
ncbi:hypothetical protein NLP75_25085, partial [Escherichia coli]|nr:hypothetical protein [Escherichia coli]